MQLGGGITLENAQEWLDAGAEKVGGGVGVGLMAVDGCPL
jgi:2-keto-3-deoxy-6-phosphogluconate aldolase